MVHQEKHRSHRSGWLRAAVLGANDGIVSTSSLIIGVAAASVSQSEVLLAGIAGLVAGAMSMAAGEYVSVCSQADAEKADLEIEKRSLSENYSAEKKELALIYQQRGLNPELAHQVAEALMAHDALAAHARDDIGLAEISQAKPLTAAISSALTFTLGAALPLLIAYLVPIADLIYYESFFSLIFLAFLGAVSARAGGAPILKAAARVTFWGALAMVLTASVGFIFGIST